MLTLPRELTNEFLARLPTAERRKLLAACETVKVVVGDEIYAERGRMSYVYFPLDAIFSELTPSSHPPVEAFLTGHESMVGFLAGLDLQHAPMHCSVQGTGQALRMKAAEFAKAVDSSTKLRGLVHCSVYYQMQQMARNIYCMRHHELSQRLARWMLMAGDRHRSPRFRVTHKFLAAMLGTRRAGVTVAAAALQARRLIRYRRGEVELLDRAGLEQASCGCYRYSITAHKQAFGR